MSFDELPEEVCINMWSYLDFETVQKTCTLVCRRWFATIRNSGKLSGTLALDLEPMFSAEIFYPNGNSSIPFDFMPNWMMVYLI